jgi:hypothetical protein
MSYARQLLDSYPGDVSGDVSMLTAAIDALADCAQACVADADADLHEQNLAEMVMCIRLCWDCADICTATLGVVSRRTAYTADVARLQLAACIAICRSCGDECQRHASHHQHCRVCEQACRRCEQACRELLDAMRS